MKTKGYTLIELIITISLLVIVLVGGTTIFYRSFRSSGVSDIQATLNDSLNSLDTMIESVLRYGAVIRLVDADGNQKLRADCLEASDSGVVGNSLIVRDSYGGNAVYSLSDGEVSSNAGEV